MIQTCPKCGSSFNCTDDEDCWCEKTQIHKREMILLMKSYDDCLCPECLKEFEEE